MNADLHNSEEIRVALVALFAALLLASNEVTLGGFEGWMSSYAYWVVRIAIESAFFVATLYALEKYVSPDYPQPMVITASILISLFPFTLAITSLDLIVGLPELGLNETQDTGTSRLQAFGQELFYLLDNHLVLCAMLLLPRLLLSTKEVTNNEGEQKIPDIKGAPIFHEAITPPLNGLICRIEAQEHYIRIITTSESRMVLYRFSDAVREMPSSLGMQVHRSHWIAFSAIEGLMKDGQKLKLKLSNKEIVPVSRSFHPLVEERFPLS